MISSVSDPPVVTLILGKTLIADEIKEGEDVYFECCIEANPEALKISWLHNVRSLLVFIKVMLLCFSVDICVSYQQSFI